MPLALKTQQHLEQQSASIQPDSSSRSSRRSQCECEPATTTAKVPLHSEFQVFFPHKRNLKNHTFGVYETRFVALAIPIAESFILPWPTHFLGSTV